MSKVLGWAIVGCGDVADRKIGPYFKRDPGCQLISVMRRNGAAAESFARRHGAANWSTDAQETIRHPDVDAVYIATPPANHLEYALAVAAAGKPCVVEKPAGRSLAEFRSLRDAFRAANLPLFVSYYRRYLPRFLKVKEILDSGVLGPIVSIDYRKSKPAQQGGWALEVAQSGGGQFYAVSCHMLDLFDFWFGPLEYTGSSATNSIPCQSSEDAVALSFRTKGGAVGAALWNYAASNSDDRLIIDGRRGRITMRGTPTDKSVRVDLDPKGKIRIGQGRSERWVNNWWDRLGLPDGEVHRFPKVEYPHEAMLKEITARIGRDRDIPDNADAALRTAKIVDRSLASYYGGRDDEFWTRPSTWQSLHAKALRRNHDPLPSEYRLIEEHIRTFETTGYIGPFRCDADWQRLIIPEKMDFNRHLGEEDIFGICTHPSVIRRVAQVMGRSRFSLFKTRFPVKLPHSKKRVPWHQDVGWRNGGFAPDGKAVPTLVVFMAIDEMDPGNGGLEVIPGSHRRLIGDLATTTNSQLVETGALTQADLDRSEPFLLRPGEFMIFHGWLLHHSGPNASGRRRAAMNMRFAPLGLEYDDMFIYTPIKTAGVPHHNSLFMNEVWGGKPNDANLAEVD